MKFKEVEDGVDNLYSINKSILIRSILVLRIKHVNIAVMLFYDFVEITQRNIINSNDHGVFLNPKEPQLVIHWPHFVICEGHSNV